MHGEGRKDCKDIDQNVNDGFVSGVRLGNYLPFILTYIPDFPK